MFNSILLITKHFYDGALHAGFPPSTAESLTLSFFEYYMDFLLLQSKKKPDESVDLDWNIWDSAFGKEGDDV